MRAVWYEEQGTAADVLTYGEMDDPNPEPGEVLVRIAVSSVRPHDTWHRAIGRWPKNYSRIIPHSDGAGVIEATGGGVPESRIGERVWIWGGAWRRPFGTAAELVALPIDRVYPLPDNMSFAEGSCLAGPGITAHYGIFADGPVTGQTIFITGGAGRAANYAIQFAKHDGATIISTVSGKEKADMAAAAGADHIINYRTEDVTARVMELTGGEGVDRIFEVNFGANLPVSVEIIKEFGVITPYDSVGDPEPGYPFNRFQRKQVTIHHISALNLREDLKTRALGYIAKEIKGGWLQHNIGLRLPLSETVAAHEAVEAGTLGAVVIEVGANASD